MINILKQILLFKEISCANICLFRNQNSIISAAHIHQKLKLFSMHFADGKLSLTLTDFQ